MAQSIELCSPTKDESRHIGFSADPVGVGICVGIAINLTVRSI